ncbi:MAG: hypothetical protein JWP06_138 [Candidatus Saccharibacteria bacterium]|nr:hypothetical protein [Candidatus Saccharibacteria bacterium]
MNADNIVSKVTRVYVKTALSKKTNEKYSQLKIEFVNGYTFTAFLNDEQIFAVKDAMKTQTNNNDLLDQVD